MYLCSYKHVPMPFLYLEKKNEKNSYHPTNTLNSNPLPRVIAMDASNPAANW